MPDDVDFSSPWPWIITALLWVAAIGALLYEQTDHYQARMQRMLDESDKEQVER